MTPMPKLPQIDANLLVALDVLLEERHVTRAAERIGVTQSAMSQTLQRLRGVLEDPVLIRSGGRMVPTPRAEAMRVPLRTALRQLDQLLELPERFDPSTADRTFRLATLDIYSMSLVAPLMQHVATEGSMTLDVAPLDRDTVWDELRDGTIELAIIGPLDVPADIDAAPILREQMVGLARTNHPIFDQELTPERYIQWPHVVFRITGRGQYPIDQRLAVLGLERRIAGSTPFFLSAPAMVVESDLIVTVPLSAARQFAAAHPLRIFTPPIRGKMQYTVSMVWPRHLSADPGHQWLRGLVSAIALDRVPPLSIE